MELDARWLEQRVGYGIDLPIGDRGALEIHALAAGGLASIVPGAEIAQGLDLSGEDQLFGPQAGAAVSIELRYQPLSRLIVFMSLNARERSLFDDTALHRLAVGGTFSLYSITGTARTSTVATLFGTALGLRLGYERERIIVDGHAHDIDHLHAGIQFGFK